MARAARIDSELWVRTSYSMCPSVISRIATSQKLYGKHGVVVTSGVANVVPDEPFNIVVTHFSNSKQTLPKNQSIAAAFPHRTDVVSSSAKLAEVLRFSTGAEDLSKVGEKTSKTGEAISPVLSTTLSLSASARGNAEKFVEETIAKNKEGPLAISDATIDHLSPEL